MNNKLIQKCKELLVAYKSGQLGQTKMPEEMHPLNMNSEERLIYFTLPMALNYQRDSYKMWEAAKKTFEDKETRWVFNLEKVSKETNEKLSKSLLKHKLALQPNKHTATWKTICQTINSNFGSIEGLINKSHNDFLELKDIIQVKYKKGFPYLSGPKIFNYWSFILQEYGGAKLVNSNHIEIAPDTHVTQCSVILGVINKNETKNLTKEEISNRWRIALEGSGITPIQMHSPLWFWSRNNFQYKLKN